VGRLVTVDLLIKVDYFMKRLIILSIKRS
jgi:hypothetical protein